LVGKDVNGTQVSGFGDGVKISPTGDRVAMAGHNQYESELAWYIWTTDENGAWINKFDYQGFQLSEEHRDG
jgi:hypothetical protein